MDGIWCLGDLVGYGAQPNECVELAERSVDLCLIGNHDLVVIDKLDITDFSMNAATAAEWTKEELGSDARAYLEKLEPLDEEQALGLYHASPRDPVWEYVLSSMAADDCIDAMKPRVGAVGHSHVALAFWREGDDAGRGRAVGARRGASTCRRTAGCSTPAASASRATATRARAGCCSSSGSWKATWRRTEYPIDEAADAIRDAGLPAQLADRLYYGQ